MRMDMLGSKVIKGVLLNETLKALATIPYFNFHFFSTLADIFAI